MGSIGQQCKHGKCKGYSFTYSQSHVSKPEVWTDKTSWLFNRCCGQGMQKGYREVVAYCLTCERGQVIGGAKLLYCGCCKRTLVYDSWGNDEANQWKR